MTLNLRCINVAQFKDIFVSNVEEVEVRLQQQVVEQVVRAVLSVKVQIKSGIKGLLA